MGRLSGNEKHYIYSVFRYLYDTGFALLLLPLEGGISSNSSVSSSSWSAFISLADDAFIIDEGCKLWRMFSPVPLKLLPIVHNNLFVLYISMYLILSPIHML